MKEKFKLDALFLQDVDVMLMIRTLAITCIIGIYIFMFYRIITRKSIYSKFFNISLVGVAMITAAIIVTIQSSLVVSLGMVGALSIVRFRTPIKEPLDLMFLFWAISIGIICGAGLFILAVLLSVALTIVIFVLDRMPLTKASMILIVNSEDITSEQAIMDTVKEFAKQCNIKSRNLTDAALELTVELRTSKGAELTTAVMSIECVKAVNLLTYSGEAVF